jgi:hypothetical protein
MWKFTKYLDMGFKEARVNFCGIPGNLFQNKRRVTWKTWVPFEYKTQTTATN